MDFIKRKFMSFLMKDITALNKFENPEFAEELRKLNEKKPPISDPPKMFRKSMDVKECKVDGGVYFRARDKKIRSNKKVLFLHGGGFFLGASAVHWAFCRNLAKETGCEIILPDYPMVPDSNSKASNAMLLEVYKRILKNTRPEDLVIIGDSAGGTLAMTLSMLARDNGLPVASELILISPGFILDDMTEKERKRLEHIKKKDFLLDEFPFEQACEIWRGDLDSNDYRAYVIKGTLKGLPHITLFSGTHDIMNVPARRLVAKMKKEGHPFSYHEKIGGIHDYALLNGEHMLILLKIIG